MSETLLADLGAEESHYQALLALLKRERDALRRAQADEVEAIAHEKQASLPRLADFARARVERLRQAGYSSDAPGMQRWLTECATSPPACLAAWQRVLALVEEVRRWNQTNGQLIELQARYFSLAVATLRSAGGASAVYYGADGRVQAVRDARPLASI